MRRRKRHQQSFSLFYVLFLVLLLGAAAYGLWKMFYTPEGIPQKTNIISLGKESPKIRLEESSHFSKIYGVDELWEKESLHSEEGNVRLVFFEGSTLTLDTDTIVTLEKVRKNEDNSSHIRVVLDSGRIWADVASSVNPESQFVIETKNFLAVTKGGSFSIDPYSIVTTKGLATVAVGKSYSKDIEVGQQIAFSEEDLVAISNGQGGPQKELLSDAFRMGNWFKANTQKEGLPEEVVEEDEAPFVVGEEEADENPLQIIVPGKNGSIIKINESPIRIEGSVPEGTTKVIVNGYTLSKFVTGDTHFLYIADTQWQTLEDGENVYTVVALGADGERHEAKITILYNMEKSAAETEAEEEDEKENVEEIVQEEITAEEEVEEEPETVTGKLRITHPKDGDTLTKAETVVSGTAPSNAEKIVVNGYPLSKFKKGKSEWTYIIADRLGNRPVGDYVIRVEAKDANGKILGSESITITIKELPKSQSIGGDELEMREGTLPPVEGSNNEPTI
jgi:hypothetical protein